MPFDLSFITQFKDEPIALFFISMVFIIVVYIWKVGPRLKGLDVFKSFKDVTVKVDTVASSLVRIETDMNVLLDGHKNQERELKNIGHLINDLSLDVLKNTAWNSNLPMPERMYAAYRFIRLGGNSATKALYEELARDNRDIASFIEEQYRRKDAT
jgi:hypothetical protein